ncbi:hypothetical protein FDH01_gp202 [Acinetobacter phage vB_AbaM_ME3]|uniref:Uncharacterized protein n=1 Tax=Acinetobacter phage vB_AbaM_ME3 TaxID=1837876 RepID=A0A172Q0M7_9CAUD|nr:hypothetical protein FDH01_gp202 [Acinetobacter phage vB_AbaM_ME3]AND75420.1 hypothetical protein ME3_259 [Acinetobacter phage vB_AbaM_ME3]
MRILSIFKPSVRFPSKFFALFKSKLYEDSLDSDWIYASAINSKNRIACINVRRMFPEFHENICSANLTTSVHTNFIALLSKSLIERSTSIQIYGFEEYYEYPSLIANLKSQEEIEEWIRQNI